MIRPVLGGLYEYTHPINRTSSKWRIINIRDVFCDLQHESTAWVSTGYEIAYFSGDYWREIKEDNFTKLYLTLKTDEKNSKTSKRKRSPI